MHNLCISILPEDGYSSQKHIGVVSYLWISEICCEVCW